MKKTFLFILIIFTIAFSPGKAQSNFRDGFIISLTNDTIYGKIAYKLNSDNYKVCEFKLNDEITRYSPSQLKGYGFINDKFYISGILENTFVELLVDGPLRLFRYNSFYVQKSGTIHELVQKEIKIEKNGETYIQEDTRWRGIIRLMISDSDMDMKIAQELKLNEKSLTRLVKEYNDRKGSKITVFKEHRQKSHIDYGLSAGVTSSFLSIKKDFSNLQYLNNSYGSTDFSFGLYNSVSLPIISEKLAVQYEAWYVRSEFSSSVTVRDASAEILYYDTRIRFSTITVPVGLKYRLIGKNFPLYLLGGVSCNINLNSSSSVRSERVRSNVVSTSEYQALQIAKTQIGYWGGIEINKPFESFKIGASLRYYHGANMSPTEGLTAGINRISFSLILIK
jgi:hypothetical protein